MPISQLPLQAMGMTIRWGLNRTMLPAPLLKEPQDRGTMIKNPRLMMLVPQNQHQHKKQIILLHSSGSQINGISMVNRKSIEIPRCLMIGR